METCIFPRTATHFTLLRTSVSQILLLLLFISFAEAARLDDRQPNGSRTASAGLFWSSSVDEADLLRKPGFHEDPAIEDIDGGFSTLDGMLQWAIGHSDPHKLKQAAQDVHRLSPEELENRRIELLTLVAIKNLLLLESTVFKDFCGLENTLENVREHLLNAMDDDDRRSFVIELENLRAEVAILYQNKLKKAARP